MSDETFDPTAFDRDVATVASLRAADVRPSEIGMDWFAVEAVQIVGRLIDDAAWCRREAVLGGLVEIAALSKVAHAHAKAQFDAQTGRG
jgi:hypothetical protein